MESGKWIRALREERAIRSREIERVTRDIADTKGNPDYYISHSTLSDIESGAIPSIHKLFSLAYALKIPLNELLLPFGIDQGESTASDIKSLQDVNSLSLPPVREPPFRFHLNFDTNISPEETTLLKIQSQDLATLPPPLRTQFDLTRYRYASIGSKDDTMSDLLPPRSLVEIDTAQKSIQVFEWRALRDRPIYLVWHSAGHTCCWCQSDGKELTLIPHPLSRRRVRRFKMPTEANVVGRVTNAWLSFDPNQLQREAAS